MPSCPGISFVFIQTFFANVLIVFIAFHFISIGKLSSGFYYALHDFVLLKYYLPAFQEKKNSKKLYQLKHKSNS